MLLPLLGLMVAPIKADLVIVNANVVTLDANKPRAEAVGVVDGKIVFVGSSAEARELGAPQVIDLKGATLFPGFADCHFHLTGVGEREMSLNLEGTPSLDALLAKVKEKVAEAEPGEWIVGRGWIETHWKPPVFPTRQQLDSVSPNNPVFLERADGHAAVTNSIALSLAKVDDKTPNPSGGEFSKDASGSLTGMVLDNAMSRFIPLLPRFSAEDFDEMVIRGSAFAARHGLTQVQVAGGSWNDVERLRRLYGEGKVHVRVYQAIHGPSEAADRLIKEGPIVREQAGLLTVRGIKVVSDGALGSRGAFLLEKYNDADTRGFMTESKEAVYPMLVGALKAGIQVETHAIGDAANRTVLDWYAEAMREAAPSSPPRWRIEHAQNVHDDDLPRFKQLGVIASMQPSHAIGDLHFAPRRLGIDRLSRSYRWKDFLNTGVALCGGSDAPVERGDPRIEFYAAVSRKDMTGFSGEGWHPEQRLDREQALKMFTLGAAYAAFEEDVRGSIEVGKWADFTAFDKDLMTVPEPEILTAECVLTMVGGKPVYRKN